MAVATVPMTKLSLYFMLSLLRDDPTVDVPTAVKKHHWAYKGPEGPEHWVEQYPLCGGTKQSPIDIDLEFGVHDPSLEDFHLSNFHLPSTEAGLGSLLNFTNNGHSASVRVTGDLTVEGGGLPGRFRTAEFHFHWGSHSAIGSEHAVHGQKYPLEMHVVNYAEKYGTLGKAKDQDDGLAVLGVLFQVSDRDNPDFEPLADALQHIHKSGEFRLVNGVRLRALLPTDTSRFYRYSGSLTTPHCYESVTWTVFDEPQKISERQLGRLRDLLHESGHYNADSSHSTSNSPSNLVDNWRPLQALNGRVIRQSFPLSLSSPTSSPSVSSSTSSSTSTLSPLSSPEATTTTAAATTREMTSTTVTKASTSTTSASVGTSTTVPSTTPQETTTATQGYKNRPGGVMDPSLVLLTSNKQGTPLEPPTFKSLTEVNNAHDQKVLISGAPRVSPVGQDGLQSTGGKESHLQQPQGTHGKQWGQPPHSQETQQVDQDHQQQQYRERLQQQHTQLLELLKQKQERRQQQLLIQEQQQREEQQKQQQQQQGSETGVSPVSVGDPRSVQTTTPTTTSTTSNIPADDPSSIFRYPTLHKQPTTQPPPVAPQPAVNHGAPHPSRPDVIHPSPRQQARLPSSPSSADSFAFTLKPPTTAPSVHHPSVARVRELPPPTSVDKLHELATRLKQLLEERRARLQTGLAASSSPAPGSEPSRPSSPPARPADFNTQYRQQQWQQQQHVTREQDPGQLQQRQAEEQRMRERRRQTMMELQSLLLEGLRRDHAFTQSTTTRSPRPTTPPPAPRRSVTQVLQNLKNNIYTAWQDPVSPAGKNFITSGAAAIRRPGSQPSSPPVYTTGGSRTVVGSAREQPYVFLHTFKRPMRISRTYYDSLYNSRPSAGRGV